MASVVTEPCLGCKHTDCVVVCPTECFVEGAEMLFISPDDCISCGACGPECPVSAIYDEADVPEKWISYIPLNAEMARQLPRITEKKTFIRGNP